MMSNQKDKAKNEGESESGEGLVDLGLDEEADEQKIFEIAKEEEKRVQEFLKSTNKKILEKECDMLAYYFLTQLMLWIKQKKELTDIQSKKATKSQQKKEPRAQIKYNNFKRQGNEVLARLIVISTHIGKCDQYFVQDPMGNTESKHKEFVEKAEKANQVAQALVHEEEQKHAQEEAKLEKQKKGTKVVHFNL